MSLPHALLFATGGAHPYTATGPRAVPARSASRRLKIDEFSSACLRFHVLRTGTVRGPAVAVPRSAATGGFHRCLRAWIGLAAVSLIFAGLCVRSDAVEIIAHRGASYDAPENTLASVKLGWKQNADAVEIDIYLSKDGQIVLLHDDNTKRTTGLDRKVSELTFSEVRALDAGTWKGPTWSGEKIPSLDEVLATIAEGKRLFIEIKCGPEIIPPLAQAVKKSGKKPEQIVLIGFSFPTMELAKKTFPDNQVYWLSGFKQDKQTGAWSPTADELIEKAKAAGFDGLNLSCKGPLDERFIQKVRAAHLKMFTWTVNDPIEARRLVSAGVEGITTDRPAWLREQLR